MKAKVLKTVSAAAALIPATALAAKTPEPSTALGMAQTLFALALVVALIFALAWFVRRIGGAPGATSGVIRLVAGLSVGTRERVVLVQVGSTQLLVGVAPGRVQTLHVLDKPLVTTPVTNASGNASNSFAERLASMIKQGRGS
jgi:flagellar protein FliO/FliZ